MGDSRMDKMPINIADIPQLEKAKVLSSLESGTLLITANRRLSQAWLSRFDQYQQGQGKLAWQTAHVLPWSAWLRTLWEQGGDERALVSPFVELWQWRAIIEESFAESSLIHSHRMAEQAQAAYKLMSDYELDDCLLSDQGCEADALYQWVQILKAKDTIQVLDSKLTQGLIDMLQRGELAVPRRLLMDGFIDLPPIANRLLHLLQRMGCQLMGIEEIVSLPSVQLISCQYDRDELRYVCSQVRELLGSDRMMDEEAVDSIGVIVPNLADRSEQVLQIFREEFEPKSMLLSQSNIDHPLVFNLSLGASLVEQPMIHTALLCLMLPAHEKVEFSLLTQLLRSPFLRGGDQFRTERALLEVELRERCQPEFILKYLLEKYNIDNELRHILNVVHKFIILLSTGSNKLPSAWLRDLHVLLEGMGCYAMAESANEHAQLTAWHEILMQLASLDRVCGTISWGALVAMIRQSCTDQFFRPDPSHASVQVMGTLEAVGLTFDHLFVIGMDDVNWPPKPNPNPLIPFPLQQQAGMPHVDADREWTYAQRIWQRLCCAAPSITVSYAKEVDQQQRRISSVLQAWAGQEAIHIYEIPTHSWRQQAFGSKHEYCERITVATESRVAVEDSERIRGGSAILKDQSACPFRSFAIHRLAIRPLKTVEAGVNAMEKGSLLHRALELFWGEVHTHAALLELLADPEACESKLQHVVYSAWRSITREVGPKVQQLESTRLCRLLRTWLQLEAMRIPFTVEEREQRYRLCIPVQGDGVGDFELSLVVDRIDRDQEGHLLLIDYKTGASLGRSAMMGDRPDEPQLPLYRHIGTWLKPGEKAPPGELEAVAFAIIRADGCKFDGVARDDGLLPRIKAYQGRSEGRGGEPIDWQALTTSWHQVLSTLATEFVQGVADVAPKTAASCQYCGLQALCRIDEVGEQKHG
ncbi:MAG: PD-(D/E)XK nuclease family protein [Mariprofundaceae bacterium]